MKALLETMMKEMDNAKLLMLVLGACLFLLNFGLVIHLLFMDGTSTQELLTFMEQEITLLIPTSGIVSIIQHAVTTWFSAKKPPSSA